MKYKRNGRTLSLLCAYRIGLKVCRDYNPLTSNSTMELCLIEIFICIKNNNISNERKKISYARLYYSEGTNLNGIKNIVYKLKYLHKDK